MYLPKKTCSFYYSHLLILEWQVKLEDQVVQVKYQGAEIEKFAGAFPPPMYVCMFVCRERVLTVILIQRVAFLQGPLKKVPGLYARVKLNILVKCLVC